MKTPELPSLLRVSQAIAYLDTPRTQLVNLYPHLHVLALPRGSRRLPRPYVVGFENFFRHHFPPPYTVQSAREFAETDEAHAAIQAAEADLEADIARHTESGRLWAADVATILNLGRMSVNDWVKSGELVTERVGARTMVDEASLHAAYQWHHPEDYERPYTSH